MKKIIILFCFFTLSCWSQNVVSNGTLATKTKINQYVSLDSLDKQLVVIISKIQKSSLKSNSKKLHTFLKLLSAQKKVRKLTNKDDHNIKELQASTMIELIINVAIPNKWIDSTIYYKNKILLLTDIPNIRANAYGAAAFAYQENNMLTEAVKHHEKTIEEYKHSNKKDITKHKIIPLVNIIECLLKLGSIEHAHHRMLALSQTINKIPQHPRYNQWQQLIKIMQASIFVEAKKYGQALDILTAVDKSKINTQQLFNRYHLISYRTQTELANYAVAEDHLEKQFSTKENIDDISNITYYIGKLSFALYAHNKEKAAIYFKKINKLTTANKAYKSPENFEVLSRYYASKNNYSKAFDYLKRNNLLQYTTDRKNAKLKLDIDHFYVQVNTALLDMKPLNIEKDALIVTNRIFYISIGIITLTLISIILLYLKGYRKTKQYKLDILAKSNQTLLASKQVFLENMFHEIRTPITAIIGYLSLLQEHNLNAEKTKKYADSALHNIKKMTSSLNHVSRFVRTEKDPLVNNKKTSVNLKVFVQKVVHPFLPDFETKNMRFYYKTNTEDNLSITYDLESLKTILHNLISNAIKYAISNTDIYFTLNFTKTHLQIIIKDQGVGISKAEKDKIFSRFYQNKNNETNGGFGLFLTAELVQRLNGVIRLQTELNVGSIFFIDLPYELPKYSLYTSSAHNEFKLLSPEPFLMAEIKENFNYPKALIVDDNLVMIAYLKELFSGSLECTFAFNGAEALIKAKQTSFDIIISDLRMPLMNGIDFKEALNKIDDKKEIPFILITAVSHSKLNNVNNIIGLHEYLEKPFTKDEILSRVQFVLERSMNRKNIFNIAPTNIVFESSCAALVEKIKECILSNLTNTEFNVFVLAEMCGYEQKKLNHILKSKLGLSLVHIILEVRLLKAYDLIIKNRFPTLNEVIYAVGFNSRSYFNKKFEQRFGLKAGDFKKKNSSLYP